jgi:hypothetical protein
MDTLSSIGIGAAGLVAGAALGRFILAQEPMNVPIYISSSGSREFEEMLAALEREKIAAGIMPSSEYIFDPNTFRMIVTMGRSIDILMIRLSDVGRALEVIKNLRPARPLPPSATPPPPPPRLGAFRMLGLPGSRRV